MGHVHDLLHVATGRLLPVIRGVVVQWALATASQDITVVSDTTTSFAETNSFLHHLRLRTGAVVCQEDVFVSKDCGNALLLGKGNDA